jgi:hypothetical protein
MDYVAAVEKALKAAPFRRCQTLGVVNLHDLEEYGEDAVQGALYAAEPNARMEDQGIGAYEYWGFKGRDVRMVAVAEPDPFVVRFPGLAVRPDLAGPWEPMRVTYTRGGCDGEHSGRCRPCCAEIEVAVVWTESHREVRGDDVYVVFEGEQDDL